jgi:hypothetical protein
VISWKDKLAEGDPVPHETPEGYVPVGSHQVKSGCVTVPLNELSSRIDQNISSCVNWFRFIVVGREIGADHRSAHGPTK